MSSISESDVHATASGREPLPGSGRLTLLLIAGIPVTVILAATWMWYFVARGDLDLVGALGTANKGELVQPPRQAEDAGWQNAEGAAFGAGASGTQGRGRWTFVIPQRNGECAAACEQRLFETRQIHMSLGKDLGRVDRLLVTPAEELSLTVASLSDGRPVPENFRAYLASEQRGLSTWRSDATRFDAMFPELSSNPNSWYLMDPAGWVMMRYDPTVDYKDVISDLKFLIKNSNG